MDMLPPPLYHDQSTQTIQDICMQNELRVTFHNVTCLEDLVGIDDVTSYVKSALSQPSKTMTLYYFCSNRLGLEIYNLFEKKEKTEGDIKRLSKLFSYTDEGLYPLMCGQLRDRKWHDSNFYAQIRSNQIILLLILDAVKNNKGIEDKKDTCDSIAHSYKQGLVLLDKARRFWRDEHQNAGQTCYSVGDALKPTFYHERYVQNGTQSYLTALYTQLHEHYLVVIHGSGGMGKSTLARAYAEEAETNKAYGFIGWLNAESEETLKKSYSESIETLEMHFKILYPNYQLFSYVEQTPLKDFVKRLNFLIMAKNFIQKSPLFIFDSAESYEKVHTFIPQVGHAIVTTRMDPNAVKKNLLDLDVPAIKLDVFSDSEASSYVKTILKDKNPTDDEITSLCRRLGNHPLALSVACGYIKKYSNIVHKITIETFN
jgi:hypothetical protein